MKHPKKRREKKSVTRKPSGRSGDAPGAPEGGRGRSIWIDRNRCFSVPAGPRQRNDRRQAGKRQRGGRRRDKTKISKSFAETMHF